jgi:hypothetical protein
MRFEGLGDTMSNSAKYRQAAAMCRLTAESSDVPDEWLGFAAEWDKMAKQAETVSACESEFKIARRSLSQRQSSVGIEPVFVCSGDGSRDVAPAGQRSRSRFAN